MLVRLHVLSNLGTLAGKNSHRGIEACRASALGIFDGFLVFVLLRVRQKFRTYP